MKGFILSLQSEFYKSRKTLGFWSSIILPLLICLLVFVGFYSGSAKFAAMPGMMLWLAFAGLIMNVMGTLLLPMYVIFVAYSVNSIEHKADTWKTLFTLPISKWSVYAAKYFFAFLLVLLCLLLFMLFTIGFGDLLGLLKPELKFYDYHIEGLLAKVYFKLFMAALGILSIQFLLSLLWSDFLKPMGIGFIGTVSGVIMGAAGWQYAWLFPYAHPLIALKLLPKHNPHAAAAAMPEFTIDLLSKEIFVSLGIAVVVFVAGFFIVQKKSVK